ncbi:ATP-binding protein [Pelagibius sp.]|uniref:ATP-binding protein n=1 Tax=Pelagibius sp. TaxID=1931238 RepID=UPI00261DF75D|nr:ATP-binding protein [Pelagibius sp.]
MNHPKQNRQTTRQALADSQRRSLTHLTKDVKAAKGGMLCLFTGPSGSGKALAAKTVASDLGRPLHRVSLKALRTKYIGETEKNLKEVFARAESASAILLFDEADALFGKRSDVEDAHDRYANQEVSYLLDALERFGGLVILTANRKDALDEALARRLRHMVDIADNED